MGEVFAARLVGLHGVERLVAIKTLRVSSATYRAALLGEARVTARVYHPNVVATMDLDEVGDVPYIVMELIDGASLDKLLQKLHQRRETLSPHVAAWIAMQCALGLHAAHELTDPDGRTLGLVHRDVSPQNILLAVTGEVKVADFGIAKYLGRENSTGEGEIKGKFAYMSPEHALNDEPDRRADIFSLGVVLWEALTGRKLFAAESPARTLIRVRELDPCSPAELRAEVSGDIAAIVLRCLAKDREQRYATGLELAEALRSALRTGGVPVDASDLAALVESLFADERADFARRIVLATSAATPAGVGSSRSGPAFPTSHALPAPWRARVGRLAAVLSVLAGAAAVAFLVVAPSRRVPVAEAQGLAQAPAAQAADPPPAPSMPPVAAESTPRIASSGEPSDRPPKPRRERLISQTRSAPESPHGSGRVGTPFPSL